MADEDKHERSSVELCCGMPPNTSIEHESPAAALQWVREQLQRAAMDIPDMEGDSEERIDFMLVPTLPQHWDYMQLQLVVDVLKSCGYAAPDPSKGRRFWRVPHEMRHAAQQMAEQLELDSMHQWRSGCPQPLICCLPVATDLLFACGH